MLLVWFGTKLEKRLTDQSDEYWKRRNAILLSIVECEDKLMKYDSNDALAHPTFPISTKIRSLIYARLFAQWKPIE